MSGLKGSLIELMADISKVKADEKVLADVEKKEFSADYDNICRKCDELKHVFPIGFEVIRKRYAKISWFSDPAILNFRLSKSASSMATAEVRALHPDMLEFEARRLMQAECGHFEKGVFVFDIKKAKTYLDEAKRIEQESGIEINDSSTLKGSLVRSSRKRIDWRKREQLAVKRMLDKLSIQRKERDTKPTYESGTSPAVSPVSPSTIKPVVKPKTGTTPVAKPTTKPTAKPAQISEIIKGKRDGFEVEYKSNTEQILRLLRNKNIRYLYHFTSAENIPSIKKNKGLYSWDYMERHGINIPVAGGDSMSRSLDMKYNLQDYVRLSFCQDHPMAYRLRMAGEKIVLLMIDIRAAAFVGTQYSDMNAADSRHHHGPSMSDLERIDFNAVKKTYVSSSDPDFKTHQAEVMVKTHIPSEYILNLDDF